MSNREMVHEHIWTDGDEKFKAEPDSGVWYKDEGEWKRADNLWASRFLRHELMRVVEERRELINMLKAMTICGDMLVCGDNPAGQYLSWEQTRKTAVTLLNKVDQS